MYHDYIVSDDDTSTRYHLTHSEKIPACKTNIGGYLPKEIPVPQLFSYQPILPSVLQRIFSASEECQEYEEVGCMDTEELLLILNQDEYKK